MFVALGVIGFIGAYLEGDLGGAVSSDGLETPTPRVTTPSPPNRLPRQK